MNDGEDGAILLIGSGARLFREYIVASLARDRTLVLLDRAAPTWQAGYLADAEVAPLDDVARTVAAAKVLAARRPLHGVLTYDERAIEVAAEVAAALGLPGHSPQAAGNCRDKALTRRALRGSAAEVRSEPVATLAQARAAAAAVGYPVVLKPRGLAGGFGVVRADTPGELESRYAQVAATVFPGLTAVGVLVEEYLDGPEVSVECVVHEGRTEIAAVTRKQLGFAPYFEETGHTVDAGDPLLGDGTLASAVQSVHERLGLTDGVTHAEFRLTGRGPRLVEVNARLGGDLIPHLVRLATGIDLAAAAAAVATGKPPALTGSGAGAAAVRFSYPVADGVVTRTDPLSRPDSMPWLDRWAWEVEPGARVALPPGGFMSRLAHVVVTGADPAECAERLDRAEALVRDRVTVSAGAA